MKIVLLSGGSGKRLWPLSNETRSKQFLKLLKAPDGSYESMVQRVYRQIREANIDGDMVIATSKTQVDSIRAQLGCETDIVIEPDRRDTFPAILLSCAYLVDIKKMDKNEVVVVLPVDPFAELDYFRILLKMEQAVQSGKGDIVLMGIAPTYPSAKYGYISPVQGNNEDVLEVEHFYEKPSEEAAEKLIVKGALWNGGVFAFKLGYLLSLAHNYAEFSSYEELRLQYDKLPKISFDYEVVENAARVAAVTYNGIWKDLGTWNTLTEVMESTVTGTAILADDCKNTHVINELDIPVIAMGLKDIVVAASPDGILVSDKHQSSFLKPLADKVEQQPMFVERCWGDYKVFDCSAHDDGSKTLIKMMSVKAGEGFSCELHPSRKEIWTITYGQGELFIGKDRLILQRGDTACIPCGQPHELKATTDMEFIEVQLEEGQP